jgi:Zn ribbon nucleic-acid-binding protein
MSIPFTKPCPECEQDMELVTADDVGEIAVYECPECGYQEETRIDREDDDLDEPQPLDASLALDDDADDEPPPSDEPE